MLRYFLLKMICYALLIIAGCSYKFDIIVKGEEPFQPVFTLNKRFPTFPIGQKVPLNDFGVYVKKEGRDYCDYRDPVWRFALRPGSYTEVRHVRYGIVPSGFKEVAESKPLYSNIPYLATAIGAGGHGATEFVIVKENGLYILKTITTK